MILRWMKKTIALHLEIDGRLANQCLFRMIQALGTLKMLKDIDKNNVIDGLNFDIFNFLKNINDSETFYTQIKDDSDDSQEHAELNLKLNRGIQKEYSSLYKQDISFDTINQKLKNGGRYLLNNSSTTVAYYGIKYFYLTICEKGKGQDKMDISKYQIKEVDSVIHL